MPPHLKSLGMGERAYGEVDHSTAQVLTGYSCFRTYLHRSGWAECSLCSYCGEVDEDAGEALTAWSTWGPEREEAKKDLRIRFKVDTFVLFMLSS